ncbi:MAG: response regulator [Cyanobacteria bacterium P01_C01_bin.69]
MNILLVEDDYLLGRSTARLLEKAGQHRVRLTHKAADVFKHCQSGAVDLVIMDVNLPGTFWQEEEVTGVDLSRMLKLQPRTARVPVVLLSANTTDSEQGRLMGEALADAIYSKPITDADEFLVLLIQVSGGRGFQGLTASAS